MRSAKKIQWIFEGIKDGLEQYIVEQELVLSLPDFAGIDPGKFNRMSVMIDKETFAVSIFKPASCPDKEAEGIPSELVGVFPEGNREFSDDHRDNPKLHRLYVAWALHDLEILSRFMEEIFSVSRWPMSLLGSEFQKKIGEQILNDAAWFEAAALLHARVDVSEYAAMVGEITMEAYAEPGGKKES